MSTAAAVLNTGIHAAKGVSAKALHIRIYPIPANLAESRGILKVLRGYGDIDTYRSLKWEHTNPAPNTSLAIFKEAESASRLMADSPLRFTLEPLEPAGDPEPSNPYLDLFNKLEAEHRTGRTAIPVETAFQPGLQEPSGTTPAASTTTTTTAAAAAEPSAEDGQHTALSQDRWPGAQKQARHFLVHASPWTSRLDKILHRAPYTGRYSIDTKSLSHRDLAQRVPLPGLSVVELGREPVPARIADKRQAALDRRPTLRQLMDRTDEARRGKGWEAETVDVSGMGVLSRRSREGGFVHRDEVERRVAGGLERGKSGDSDVDGGMEEEWAGAAGAEGRQRRLRDKDVYEQVRRRNPGPWSRKYDRMI